MIGEAIAADMDIMNPAMDYGSLRAAQVASAANSFWLGLLSRDVRRARLSGTPLQVEATRADESP